MKFPIDEATLGAWAQLLGLTAEQKQQVLNDIEADLRRGYSAAPALRRGNFERTVAAMSRNEFALMFLVAGLRRTGHADAADSVFRRVAAAVIAANIR